MPDASRPSFNARFAHDLRRIREDRGVSLGELHEETKIPLNLLEQFEETGLFDHPMFNRVYLRSLVRAYADAVDIPGEEALESLDAALTGTYVNQLAVAHLGEAPPAAAAEQPSGEPPPAEAPAAPQAPPAAETPPSRPAPPPPEPVPEAVAPQPQAPEEPEGPPVLAWEAQSPSPAQRRRPPIDFRERRRSRQWFFIVGAVVLFAGAIWGVLSLLEPPEAFEAPPVATADTAAADTSAMPPAQARPRATVGDTLDVVVIAATGKVEGIRITRDDDLRRPYWIEQGNAKEFPALQRILLENVPRRARLLVEGYEYPADRRDAQGRLLITREDAQAFLDTVSGPPVDLTSELETIRQAPIRTQ